MNTFGSMFRLSSWGESHGPAIGGIIDGCPAGIKLSEGDIQPDLDRRRPGQSSVTTQRNESERVQILSGVFNGYTTGAPISLFIANKDADSSKYERIKHMFRPGHADITYQKKYGGYQDYRGGGRSSARETAIRVAAGAVAKKLLQDYNTSITAYVTEVGGIHAEKRELEEIEHNAVRAPDNEAAERMSEHIRKVQAENDSTGGRVEILVKNPPEGLGSPVFGKLDAYLSYALMGLGAVKGVTVGAGFDVAQMRGSECNDAITSSGFASNNAGGILGGISTGEDILLQIAVKPTPSIGQKQHTVDVNNQDREITIEGRHDPCICPRIVPVAEAMVALTLADCLLGM